MKIETLEIINFKSIKHYTLNFEDLNKNETRAGIFVGLNESGKSSLLEAISLINKGFNDIDYSNYCNLDAQDQDDYIELIIKYSALNNFKLSFVLKRIKNIPSKIVENLNIKSITRSINLNNESGPNESIILDFSEIDYHNYVITTTTKQIGSKIEHTKSIIEKDKDSIDETLLDRDTLIQLLIEEITLYKNFLFPEILIWKPSDEFLINNSINLDDFKKNPEKISVPLKNIFNIYGKKTKEDIEKCIDSALKSPAKKDRLVDELSDSITKYINKVWKEHKIRIKISIDSNYCNVLIEDKDKKYAYFNMEQRSDGFKQFISLILSLSTLNESKSLVNKIILIDEPEVHLHPSGIVYMRDELLKIAKNNILLISTHSQFIIDTDHPDRHFIVNKIKGETIIKQVDNNTSFKEDSVLQSAFGLNLYKELIPNNIIVVEGGDDKYFLNHCLNKLTSIKNFSIKSAGGASKSPGFASLLSGESFEPFILFDADKEGIDNKRKILENYKPFYNNKNVFTLKDILDSLPLNATIEDLYPPAFVQKFLHEELDKVFSFNENEAIIIQLKNLEDKLKTDKQKLESIKIKLSKSFVETYSTKESLETIDKIKQFITNLSKIISKE